jgi:hypothetical protein
MKKIFVLFILFFFLFGCIELPEEKLDLSEEEITPEEAKNLLLNSDYIGIIMDSRGLSQENKVEVYQCGVGYSRSLGEKNKTIFVYGIDNNLCLNDELGETTISECSKHIKENMGYTIYLVGGKEAETIFYEDNMKVVVPKGNVVECVIR